MSASGHEMTDELEELRRDIQARIARLHELRRRGSPESVSDYVLRDFDGKPVKLSQAFGDQSDLIVIHNMGTGCAYCTMWADGFNGVLRHLQNRTAFVVVSPDPPKVQRDFAARRGWSFRMLSAADSSFIRDLGFWRDEAEETGKQPGPIPGMSTFRKNQDGNIVRVARDRFGPGDPYCAVWHMFDLLAGGRGDWEPGFDY